MGAEALFFVYFFEKRVGMKTFLLHNGNPGIYYLLNSLQIPHGTKRPSDLTANDVIIQWGLGDEDGECLKLNPSESIKRAKDKKQMFRILKLHGIEVSKPYKKSEVYSSQRFIIPIFNLDALAVYQRNIGENSAYFEVDLTLRNRSVSRVVREAIKSVYCLGLDFAVVSIELQRGNKRFVVHNIDPDPVLQLVSGKLFAQAINRYSQQLVDDANKNERAVLGMDPEFMLCKPNGKIVSAARYLQRQGRAGCDSVVVKGKVVFPLVELRPKPSVEPKQLLIHLLQAMHIAAKKINEPELIWIAGGMPKKGFPLGGHLHMSGIWLNTRLLRALDNYLAMPLILIEDQSTHLRRPRYGFLGDFRRSQIHGGFEYRTLPSWIVSPRVTKGVIALTRIIADHYRELNLRPLNNEYIQRCYYLGKKEALIGIVLNLWNDLEQLKSYDQYRAYLDPMKKQILAQQPWNESKDFRKAWRIPPFQIKESTFS